MEITGPVVSVRRRRSQNGLLYITAVIGGTGPDGSNSRLTWLHGSGPVPARGQRVTIRAVPMMIRRSRGIRTNIGAPAVTIHEQETP